MLTGTRLLVSEHDAIIQNHDEGQCGHPTRITVLADEVFDKRRRRLAHEIKLRCAFHIVVTAAGSHLTWRDTWLKLEYVGVLGVKPTRTTPKCRK